MQLKCDIFHIIIDKRGLLQQKYSQPPILPSPHWQWVVNICIHTYIIIFIYMDMKWYYTPNRFDSTDVFKTLGWGERLLWVKLSRGRWFSIRHSLLYTSYLTQHLYLPLPLGSDWLLSWDTSGLIFPPDLLNTLTSPSPPATPFSPVLGGAFDP